MNIEYFGDFDSLAIAPTGPTMIYPTGAPVQRVFVPEAQDIYYQPAFEKELLPTPTPEYYQPSILDRNTAALKQRAGIQPVTIEDRMMQTRIDPVAPIAPELVVDPRDIQITNEQIVQRGYAYPVKTPDPVIHKLPGEEQAPPAAAADTQKSILEYLPFVGIGVGIYRAFFSK
jgi:hypothetical protein